MGKSSSANSQLTMLSAPVFGMTGQLKRKTSNAWHEEDNDNPWYRYQERMLQMRARGFCARDGVPDVLARPLYPRRNRRRGDATKRAISRQTQRPLDATSFRRRLLRDDLEAPDAPDPATEAHSDGHRRS